LYEADFETPRGQREALLESVFDDAPGDMALGSVTCKSSICKVTYALAQGDKRSSTQLNAANDLLVNGISTAYGGADLDVLRGTDQYGNQVLYIQER
jgi:hypothetical protein